MAKGSKRPLKRIPAFRSEDEEARWYADHREDLHEYKVDGIGISEHPSEWQWDEDRNARTQKTHLMETAQRILTRVRQPSECLWSMGKRIDVERLRAELPELRARLDKSFSPDTALDGLQSDVPSAGHCAAATAIVWETLGGSLVSTSIKGMSHWFNRIRVDDQLVDLDITGDQFGYPAVQIKPVEELYPYTRERSPDELNDETLYRAALLARRAGLLEVAEALEKQRQLLQSRPAV